MRTATGTDVTRQLAQAIEASSWAGTIVVRDSVYPPLIETCPQDLPALLDLCAQHGVTVEAANRFGGYLLQGDHAVYEIVLSQDSENPLDITLAAAVMGLMITLQRLLTGELEPSAPLATTIRELGTAWFMTGELGAPCPALTPAGEVFLQLMQDANPGIVSSPSWDWSLHVLDQAGLLVPALLLTSPDTPLAQGLPETESP